MSELLRKQRFGVEIEFTGITRKMAAHAVAEVLRSRCSGEGRGPYHTRIIKDHQGREWKVMRDSSISPRVNIGNESRNGYDEYRVEFVTPPLKYEDIDTLQAIIRKLRDVGAIPHKSCGIHIHVDGERHTAESLQKMVDFMSKRQDLIYDALDINDRKERWCKPISDELAKEYKKCKPSTLTDTEAIWYGPTNDGYMGGISHEHYNSTRYHGLNLHSFFTKGTVEFRLFNSTLHAGKIKAYIQFCLALSAWAIESSGRVVFRSMSGYSKEQESTLMYNVLTNRLGLYGDEFKTCRYFMMKNLKTPAAESTAA